jgi:hypothetical protein
MVAASHTNFSFSTDPNHPPISVIKVGKVPEILINFNDRKWILTNREKIIQIFCNSLHPIIEKMIDELVENLDEEK